MCVSTLPSSSLSVPCIWGILQSPCRKSGAFSAKDHFAKVFIEQPETYPDLSISGLKGTYKGVYFAKTLPKVAKRAYLWTSEISI